MEERSSVSLEQHFNRKLSVNERTRRRISTMFFFSSSLLSLSLLSLSFSFLVSSKRVGLAQTETGEGEEEVSCRHATSIFVTHHSDYQETWSNIGELLEADEEEREEILSTCSRPSKKRGDPAILFALSWESSKETRRLLERLKKKKWGQFSIFMVIGDEHLN